MEYANTVAQVIQNLRDLFKDKDRLVGIDDWDNFLGCIIALEGLKSDLQRGSVIPQQETEITAEE